MSKKSTFISIVSPRNQTKGISKKSGRIWPEDLVFPKARSLTCYLGCEYIEVPNNSRDGRHFKWFMERVRLSFPNLQEITIEYKQGGMISVSPDVLPSKERNTSLCLSALFRTAIWASNEITDPVYMNYGHILAKSAPELTSLIYSGCLNGKFNSWIARKSAKTLEKLKYSEEGSGGFIDFLFDGDGQVIVYPRLRDLCVIDYSGDKGERTTDKSAVPFPVLQHLRVYSSCIFKDDTLFRGFGDTLISLDIGLHYGFADIFRKYKVFSQGTRSNLFHISATHECPTNFNLLADEFTEAAFRLVSPVTQSITLVCNISYQHIASAIPMCPYLEDIQILKLRETMLSLLEILDIFKHFPRVSDFGCQFRGIDSELDAIQGNLIPRHIGTQYSQLTSRLKCWHMYYSEDASDEEMAVLFVTLAVLCPNFTFVKALARDRETYDIEVSYILSSGLYDQHAKRLRKLFESSFILYSFQRE